MISFKSFHSARITIRAKENIGIIQKGQVIEANANIFTFKNLKMLMAY